MDVVATFSPLLMPCHTLSLCPPALHQFLPRTWSTNRPRLLVVCWWSVGGLLVVCWWSVGGLLVVCWWSVGGLLVVCWWSVGGPSTVRRRSVDGPSTVCRRTYSYSSLSTSVNHFSAASLVLYAVLPSYSYSSLHASVNLFSAASLVLSINQSINQSLYCG